MNSIDVSKKIQFAISHPTDGILKFLDLTLLVDVTLKLILVDLLSKPTKCFTYVMPSICFPRRNIKKIPESIALRLTCFFDTDSKLKIRSNKYN